MKSAWMGLALGICMSLTALAGKEIPVIQIIDPVSLPYSKTMNGYETGTTSEDLQLLNRTMENSVLNFKVNKESPLLNGIDCHNNHCLLTGFLLNAGHVSAKIQLVPIPFSTKQSTVQIPVGVLNDDDQIRFQVPVEVTKVKRALNICPFGCEKRDVRPDHITIDIF